MKLPLLLATLALGGCVAYVHDSGHYVDEPAEQAVAHLHQGQAITVSLADGSTVEATYRGNGPHELIVTQRGTFWTSEAHYGFAQVKSVRYYVDTGEWIEPAPLLGPVFR